MSKVDPDRLQKRMRLPRKPPAPSPRYFGEAAVARVKGSTETPLIQRWTMHKRSETDGTLDPTIGSVLMDGAPHHVFLAFKEAFNAQVALKLFLSQRGFTYDEIDGYRVKMYFANGWTPKRAVLITKPGNNIEIEQYDLGVYVMPPALFPVTDPEPIDG